MYLNGQIYHLPKFQDICLLWGTCFFTVQITLYLVSSTFQNNLGFSKDFLVHVKGALQMKDVKDNKNSIIL